MLTLPTVLVLDFSAVAVLYLGLVRILHYSSFMFDTHRRF